MQAPSLIRFNCPHCSRLFELPPALARLPLVCKGCGQPVTVPERSTAPEPEPPRVEPPRLEPAPPALPDVAPSEAPAPGLADPAPADTRNDLFEQPGLMAELDSLGTDTGPAELPPPARKVAPGPVANAAGPASDRKVLGLLVDVAVALLLLVSGVICGELLAQQSTREVLTDAGSAAKFPPVELLLWMSPALVFLLVYALLSARERSVGSWLRRRAAR